MKKLVCMMAVAFAMSLTAFAQQDNNMTPSNSVGRKCRTTPAPKLR